MGGSGRLSIESALHFAGFLAAWLPCKSLASFVATEAPLQSLIILTTMELQSSIIKHFFVDFVTAMGRDYEGNLA